MANFKVDSTQTTYNAGADFNSMMSQAANHREGNTSYSPAGSFHLGSSADYSVVGINTQQIPAMKQAIEDYVWHCWYINEWLSNEIVPSLAFKGGGVEEAFSEYIQNVNYVCDCIISYFRVFETKLDSISQAWQQSAANIKDRVTEAANTVSEGTKVYYG